MPMLMVRFSSNPSCRVSWSFRSSTVIPAHPSCNTRNTETQHTRYWLPRLAASGGMVGKTWSLAEELRRLGLAGDADEITWTASSKRALARLATSFSSNCIPFSTIQAFITSRRSLSSISPSSVRHETVTKTDWPPASYATIKLSGNPAAKLSTICLKISA